LRRNFAPRSVRFVPPSNHDVGSYGTTAWSVDNEKRVSEDEVLGRFEAPINLAGDRARNDGDGAGDHAARGRGETSREIGASLAQTP
jgi:hypothetical protein